MSDKVELVEKHKGRYGLNMCCRALGLSKGTLAYRRGRSSCSQADAHLKDEIVTTIRHHPEYGYRRIKEDIKARTGIVVNHKRLRIGFLGVGAAFTGLLFFLRYRFPGFPLHPIGQETLRFQLLHRFAIRH